jgi:hypothetical protein
MKVMMWRDVLWRLPSAVGLMAFGLWVLINGPREFVGVDKDLLMLVAFMASAMVAAAGLLILVILWAVSTNTIGVQPKDRDVSS